jgi:hypothetical protein
MAILGAIFVRTVAAVLVSQHGKEERREEEDEGCRCAVLLGRCGV